MDKRKASGQAAVIAAAIVEAAGDLRDSITPASTTPGHDAAGGMVASLTEAVMGITGGLVRIAAALYDLAAAVREGQSAEP